MAQQSQEQQQRDTDYESMTNTEFNNAVDEALEKSNEVIARNS